jgi:hypothetical protein
VINNAKEEHMTTRKTAVKPLAIFTSLGALFYGCSQQEPVEMVGKNVNAINYGTLTNPSDSNAADSKSSIAQVKRDTQDNSASFEALIASEREERIKEDKRINERIDALEGNLGKLSTYVQSEIRRLDAKDQEIEQRIVTETSRLDQNIQNAITTLRTETDSKVATLKSQQDQARADHEAKITELVKASDDAAKARSSEQAADIANLKAQVAKDKTELQQKIDAGVSGVQAALDAASSAIDAKVAALDQATKDRFEAVIKGQERSEANVRNALSRVKSDLQSELQSGINSLDKKLTDQSTELDKKYADLAAQQQKESAERKAELEKTYKDLSTQLAAQEKVLRVDFQSKLDKLDMAHEAARVALESQLKSLIEKNARQEEARSAQLEKDLKDLSAKTDRQIEDLTRSSKEEIEKVAELVSLSHEIMQERIEDLEEATRTKLRKIMAGQAQTEQNLRNAMSELKTSLETELDSKVSQLESSQKSAVAVLNAQYRDIEQRQKTEFELQQSQIAKVATDLESKLAAQKTELQKQMSADNKVLTDLLSRSLNDMESKLASSDRKTAAKIRAIAEEQAVFRDFVVNNFASKAELKLVQDYAAGIMSVTNLLGKRIDESDAATRKLLSDSILQLRVETDEKIGQVQATVNGLQTEMRSRIAAYETEVQGLSARALKEVEDLRQRMVVMRGDLTGQQAQLRDEMLVAISKQAAEFEYVSQSTKEALADQILKIDARIDKTDASLVSAKEEAQRALNAAVAKEQAERAKIQESLQGLTKELERVAQLAQRTQALTDANQEAIRALRSDFEAEKTSTANRFKVAKADLDRNVEVLRDEIKAGLDRVAGQAAAMVANLGNDVQEQFKTTAVELAQLNQRQIASQNATNQAIAAINASRDSQAEFEQAVVTPRAQTVQALVDLIRVISEVETSFIASLNPNQDAPGFYDQSFKPIMAKCEGNPEATFANALGYDSFQLLAQEYVRQLMFSSRGLGADPIFHGQPTLLVADNLHRVTALAVTRFTVSSATESCLQDVQTWARQVLYSNDANSVALRSGLAADTNLARAALKLRNSVAALATPIGQVEQLIVRAMRGQQTPEQLLAGTSGQTGLFARYAMTLLEAAQSAFLLKEREQTYDRIVSIQESFAQDNEAVRKLLNDNKLALQKEIEAFKVSNEQRMNAMTTRLNALDTSMRRAMDVMITLAARAGHSDIEAAVLDAARQINYTPTPIPVLKPAISEIQHFFLAPSLANTTNACTGATAQAGAGVRTYWQHGGWGACWVNFRRFPLAEWYGRANNMFYRVFGSAAAIRMETQGFSRTFEIRGKTSPGATIKAGTPFQGVFDLSGEGALNWYIANNRSWDGTTLNFTAMNDVGQTASRSYRVQLFSPLILDFVSVGSPRSISVEDSSARFDLQATGQVTRHGWIAGDEAGFLALDLDGSRTIKDGAQLFGDATPLANGAKAKNGYHALAQHDQNKDGVIDAKDSVYSKLVVWFDHDADGVSEPGEVKSLAETGVTRIAVDYKLVDENRQIQAGNRFKYQAKFWGPSQCPTTGCNSFDVYFGTSTSFLANK